MPTPTLSPRPGCKIRCDFQAEKRTDTETRLAAARVGRQRERDEISRQLVADGETYLLFRIGIAGTIPTVPPIFLALQETENRIQQLKDTKLKPISIQNYEILDTQKQVSLLIFLANILRYLLLFILLVLTIPILFSIFPQTKELAYKIAYYIWNPVKDILEGILGYIPNLFTIIVICLAIKYVIKGIRFLATEIDAGRLKINGFYSDWAMPTYHIVRFLLYAFMIAMIYPYLPGANSGVFQGVSVLSG